MRSFKSFLYFYLRCEEKIATRRIVYVKTVFCGDFTQMNCSPIQSIVFHLHFVSFSNNFFSYPEFRWRHFFDLFYVNVTIFIKRMVK